MTGRLKSQDKGITDIELTEGSEARSGRAHTEEPSLTMNELAETGELEISRKAAREKPARSVRFPKEKKDRVHMPPHDFKNVQNAVEAFEREGRKKEILADSIESKVGYNSLMRLLTKIFNQRVTYLRSDEGGELSLEEAREQAYRQDVTSEEGLEMIQKLRSVPTSSITFPELLDLHGYYPAAAENIWEMIKRDARKEFESGHRAAEAMEPVDYFKHAWERASYLGLRESMCREWQPKGGIELTMIDAIAQAWLNLQFWTKESVKRAETPPRIETPEFSEWKRQKKKDRSFQWEGGLWDVPYVSEQQAVEHAAQMADRWQRMYFRAVRSLRDWRRYIPQITINNAQQVNIANDGGQQINVANTEKEEEELKRINS